ncbi:MAG: sugar porter family MFS transporter [Candidatus Nanopelagicales bacterium]|nr:sugar porter family MFS transporter [Candidatus Nanopelagicales bacterium]MDZ4249804.1 sugar porter family MFS transporter [Candidatus Nanopelagicales bacterium]
MSATETEHKKEPKSSVKIVALTAATLGIIYGYDNGNIGGAQIFFEVDLDLNTEQVELVTAMIVWGEIIGCVLGGFVTNALGRKKTMILVAAGYMVFCLTSGLSVSAVDLEISRFFLGVTIGISLIAAPVFIAESVPARIRGATLVMYQVTCVSGIILGLLGSLWLAPLSDDINWRLMLGLAALPAFLLIPILFTVPETANWLMMKGRREEALASLRHLDPNIDPEPQIAEMEATIAEQTGGALGEMLRKPYLRATMFVVVLGFFIQITGINATVTYGPQIFKAMGIKSNEQSLLMAALVQVIALVAVILSMSFIDKIGRRVTLLTGIGIMIVAQIMLVVTFATQKGDTLNSQQILLGFLGLALINVGFVFGFGALVWVYSTESFPARLRAYGASAMLTADLVANLLIAQFFLTVMSAIGGAWSFGMFAILAVLAWLFVFRFAPETKGRPLDDIRLFWENGGKWPKEAEVDSDFA